MTYTFGRAAIGRALLLYTGTCRDQTLLPEPEPPCACGRPVCWQGAAPFSGRVPHRGQISARGGPARLGGLCTTGPRPRPRPSPPLPPAPSACAAGRRAAAPWSPPPPSCPTAPRLAAWATSGSGTSFSGQPIHAEFLLAGLLVLIAAIVLTLFRWYIARSRPRFAFEPPRCVPLRPDRHLLQHLFARQRRRRRHQGRRPRPRADRRTAAVATVIMDRLIALWALVWFVAVLGSIFWLCRPARRARRRRRWIHCRRRGWSSSPPRSWSGW